MKKRITALALAALMVMGTVAVAAGTEKTITVTPMGLNVNGQVVTPTKSDGTPAEVFAYDGATYAPLRYLTELNGNQVVWDASDPSTAKITTGLAFTDTVAWDGQYDVVVVGFGGAGAVAAKNAAENGAKVLIVEKAPEGNEGGNTRYSGQMFAYGNGNYENTLAYYKALAGNHKLPEAVLEVYCGYIANMADLVSSEFGLDKSQFTNASAFSLGNMSPEYPEKAGSETMSLMTAHPDGNTDGYLWSVMREKVVENSDSIDVWFESPAVHLIQDPGNKTIVGVQVERGGKILNIRADNGVVMACGGFENNPEMVETYLGLTNTKVYGTLYNTGDGHRMVMEVGADMWHMDVFEGMGNSLGTVSVIEDSGRVVSRTFYRAACSQGSVVLVGGDGSRFLNEAEVPRHGHIKNCGVWENPWFPDDMWLVLSEENYKAAVESGGIPEDYKYTCKASTLEELAKATGMDSVVLSKTIADFNSYATTGVDLEYGRSAASMKAFPKMGPYYAAKMSPVILNTQGGARRNEKAEVIGNDGNPIPHLYSAGEFGGVCALQYQGGSNIAECIIFGKIAGTNAAASKSYIPSVLSKVSSVITYIPGVETDLKVADYSDIKLGENEYLGVGSGGMGGDVILKVSITGGTIRSITVVEEHETPGIGSKALETLPSTIVKAGSTNVDSVSGATMTSNAIKAAVEDALAQAQVK